MMRIKHQISIDYSVQKKHPVGSEVQNVQHWGLELPLALVVPELRRTGSCSHLLVPEKVLVLFGIGHPLDQVMKVLEVAVTERGEAHCRELVSRTCHTLSSARRLVVGIVVAASAAAVVDIVLEGSAAGLGTEAVVASLVDTAVAADGQELAGIVAVELAAAATVIAEFELDRWAEPMDSVTLHSGVAAASRRRD